MIHRFTYGKNEKLKSKKLIESIFREGNHFFMHPLKIFFLHVEEHTDFPLKASFGVSRSNFKNAVQRNKIKRLLREAYRHEKHELYQFMQANHQQFTLFILYVGNELPEYCNLRSKIHLALKGLLTKINE